MRRNINSWFVIWMAILVGLGLTIPSFIVQMDKKTTSTVVKETMRALEMEEDTMNIPVYLSQEKEIVSIPLEAYVSGVVAAEMPPDFHLEALKAQAIAARTYIVHRIWKQDFSNVPVQGAWVTDTVTHQAYLTPNKMIEDWGIWKTALFLEKIYQAVNETKGKIMTYDGQPIDATFFSTSNGYTENSEDYWSQEIPYLRSVPSPWDVQLSPKYEQTVSFPIETFYQKLGVKNIPVSSGSSLSIQVLERTEGNRIKTLQIGQQLFSGRDIREKLGLPSTHFEWMLKDNKVEITSYGYGHGVGMSQYGAQGMALEGYTAEQIVTYYYQDIRLQDWRSILKLAE